jgi:high-affinity nickel-transport protein
VTADTPLAAALTLGFLLGMRHALDADHLAAVATLASAERRIGRSMVLGTFWGAGHAVALLAAAAAVLAFRLTIPEGIEQTLERVVAVMLMFLGGHVLLHALGGIAHPHDHGQGVDDSGHRHPQLLHLGGRPFVVGLVHGLAGSAALMLLALAAMPSALTAMLYVVLFGVGSTAGMLVISGLIGLPFAFAARRAGLATVTLRALTGAASLGMGAVLLGA